MTDRRPVSWWWALPVAAAAPAALSGILAAHGKWAPTIDNPVIAVRTHDVFTRHPPLVGVYLSLSAIARSRVRLHYLGPLQFWLLAAPLRAGGPNGVGLMLGAAAVNGLAAAGAVLVAHRLAGTRLAAIVAAATGLLAWSLGGQVLHDPWSPHLALFPFFFFLIVASAAASGDTWMLPLAALAASFVVQTHVTYVLPVTLTSIWVIVGVVVNRGKPVRRPLIVTAVVLVLCWSGPILDELFGTQNVTNVAGASAGGGYARIGFSIAWRDLVHATSIPPIWLEPFTGIIKVDTAPGWFAILTSLLVIGALIAATAWAWAKRSWSHLALCTTAIVATVGAFITSASAPVDYHSTEFLYPRRLWWMLGVLIWVALVHTAVALAAARWPGGWSRSDVPAVAFGLVAIAVALVAVWPRLGPAQDYGSAGFGPVRELAAATTGALSGEGPWELRSEGDFAQGVVGPGIASELILRDRPVVVADSNFPDLGSEHFVHADNPPHGKVLVVSGPDAGKPRPGYRLVARYDPAIAPEPYRSYHQTLLVVPVDPVAVYVSVPP